MYIATFDKGTENERSFLSTDFSETLSSYKTARLNYTVDLNEETVYQDVTPFVDFPDFETVEIKMEGSSVTIPLRGNYKRIDQVYVNVTESLYIIQLLLIVYQKGEKDDGNNEIDR